MNSDYYILEDGEQKGPFTFDELIEMEPDIHTRILSPNADGWQDACDLPEFYEYFLSLGVNFPTEDNLASFWWRLLAYSIDYIILSVFFALVFKLIGMTGRTIDLTSNRNLLMAEAYAFGIIILYNSICEASAMKGSIGKVACRLIVVDADGLGLSFSNALLRNVGKILSFIVVGIGFLSIFVSEYRQAWHDQLAKTFVIKRD